MEVHERFDLIDPESDVLIAGDLNEAQAEEGRKRRVELGQSVLVLPVRYRHPVVSVDQARGIATAWLRDVDGVPATWLASLRLHHSTKSYWTFHAPDEDTDRIPGGRLCSVDRVDGHVWTDDDFAWHVARQGQ